MNFNLNSETQGLALAPISLTKFKFEFKFKLKFESDKLSSMTVPPITGILESILYAEDLGAAREFYVRVMGLEEVAFEPGRHVFFRCGYGMLLIFNPESTKQSEVRVGDALIPRHGATGEGHLAFAVEVAALDAWQQRLESLEVEIESKIHWRADVQEGPEVRSIYFRDPAGNSIELACPQLWM